MTKDVKHSVAAQFGAVAENYRLSRVHATGEDLVIMREAVGRLANPLVLDAGCGAGHTAVAVAPVAREVIAVDLSPEMLAQVELLAAERGVDNVVVRQGDVEQLPFADSLFDAVVTRYSAHHWPDPAAALREAGRVLKPGGLLLLCDVVAPDAPALDTFLQTVELLRDGSHVRDHSVAQWRTLLAQAGFASSVLAEWVLPLDFERWTRRMATPPDRVAMLRTLLAAAPDEARQAFQIRPHGDFVLFAALLGGTLMPA